MASKTDTNDHQMARQLMAEERWGDALEVLNQARNLAPDDAVAWALTGLTRARWGDAAGAKDALTKARELGPNNVEIHAASGEVAVAAGDLASAIEHFRRATDCGALPPDYAIGMAAAHRETDDVEASLKLLESVQASARDNRRAARELALTYLARGVKEWKKVPDEDSYVPTSKQEIARAAVWFDKAQRLSCDDPAVKARMAQLAQVNERAAGLAFDGSKAVLFTLAALAVGSLLLAKEGDGVVVAYLVVGTIAYAASSIAPRFIANARLGRQTFISRLFAKAAEDAKKVDSGDLWAAGAMAGGGAMSSGAAAGHFAFKGLAPLFYSLIFAMLWPLLVTVKIIQNWVLPAMRGR